MIDLDRLGELPKVPADEDLPADMDCVYAKDHLDEALRPGVVVDCQICVRPWGRSGRTVRLWTPCCGRVRQGLTSGDLLSCPACGWRWTLYVLGWTNRFVSLGPRQKAGKSHISEHTLPASG